MERPLDRDTDSSALRAAGHAYYYALFSGLGHENIDRTFAMVVVWLTRLRLPRGQ